jgi:6-pyruvoyltetrahydropterin/6-carboxytetrahydropterin synthase
LIVHLSKEFRFEASHQLPNHDGKCARLHGHSWELKVTIAGHVLDAIPHHPKEGMAMDYTDIKAAVQPVVDMLDHRHLGSGKHCMGYVHPDDVFNNTNFPSVPTSENLLIWISKQLPSWLPWVMLQLSETCTANAMLMRDQSALWLPDMPVQIPAEAPSDDDIPF